MKLKDKIQRLESDKDIELLIKGDILETKNGILVHYDPSFGNEEEIFLVKRGRVPAKIVIVDKKDIIINESGKISLKSIKNNSTLSGTYPYTDEIYFGERLEE